MSPSPSKAFVWILFAKAYGLLLLFALFLRTDPRDIGSLFLYRRSGEPVGERLHALRHDFFERLCAFDGQFYRDIAEHGYRRFPSDGERPGMPGNYAFFPLLPALLRAAAASGLPPVASILFLNLAAGALGGLFVWRLAKDLDLDPVPPVALLLSFPTAVFQFFLYTESLFLLLTTATALFARRGRWPMASVSATLAGLCRPQGLLVSAILFGERLWEGRSARRGLGGSISSAALASLPPLLGWVTMAAMSWRAAGSPLAFLEIQRSCGRTYEVGGLLDSFLGISSYSGPLMDPVAVVLAVGLTPFLWRELPASLAFYGTALLVFPLLTGTIFSFGRFFSVAFPYFLCAGRLVESRRGAMMACLVVGLVFQAVVAREFMEWRFVG